MPSLLHLLSPISLPLTYTKVPSRCPPQTARCVKVRQGDSIHLRDLGKTIRQNEGPSLVRLLSPGAGSTSRLTFSTVLLICSQLHQLNRRLQSPACFAASSHGNTECYPFSDPSTRSSKQLRRADVIWHLTERKQGPHEQWLRHSTAARSLLVFFPYVRSPPASVLFSLPIWKLLQKPEVHRKLQTFLEKVEIDQLHRDAAIDAMGREILECITAIE